MFVVSEDRDVGRIDHGVAVKVVSLGAVESVHG